MDLYSLLVLVELVRPKGSRGFLLFHVERVFHVKNRVPHIVCFVFGSSCCLVLLLVCASHRFFQEGKGLILGTTILLFFLSQHRVGLSWLFIETI